MLAVCSAHVTSTQLIHCYTSTYVGKSQVVLISVCGMLNKLASNVYLYAEHTSNVSATYTRRIHDVYRYTKRMTSGEGKEMRDRHMKYIAQHYPICQINVY